MGVSIAEVNKDNSLSFTKGGYSGLYQGDILLTKQQINENTVDRIENKGDRSKRQAYHDKNYSKVLWSNGINYVFWNTNKCTEGSSAKCENGGFPHPRDCSKCICPSGYGEKLCNERPSGCGKILTATSEYQELWDIVGWKDYDRNNETDDIAFCHYWIEGPPGSTIEVIFQNITGNLAYDGCIWAGVEIKTLVDQRRTGYR
ncbi:Astacin (Peptidase M12A) [Parelaphostrongylus tenuis]|uniref:Astacin (Peptidase M12A) n=1 Tax=Parelaphostrongylus tenuis TaxID=148309 RepID=A0AAD5R2F3_PARTN|nr:Astacin (Peptidase M12A) [Parelaphostrongylus tenuis]